MKIVRALRPRAPRLGSVLRLLVALGCLWSESSVAAQRRADPFAAGFASIRYSVGAIVCQEADAEGRRIGRVRVVTGTGIFLTKAGDFATAAHVVAKMNERERCLEAIAMPIGVWDSELGHQILQFEPFVLSKCSLLGPPENVAFCRTSADLSRGFALGRWIEPVVFASEARPTGGTQVAFSGFTDVARPFTFQGVVVTNREVERSSFPDDIVIDRGHLPGMTGGPVFLADGRVIGMVIERRVDEAARLTIARPGAAIERARRRDDE